MAAKRYVCLAVCLLTAFKGYGQFSATKANLTEFRGHLTGGGTTSFTGMVVEVTNLRDRSVHERADVVSDGSFAFRGIPEGDYQVRVTSMYDDELANTITSVGPSPMSFEIRLPQSRMEKPGTGTVSIRQLNHPLSRQVKKLLESGHKLAQEQHYDDAAKRFREAAQDAPDCLQAHADLGLTLFRMGAWEGAVEEFRAAISLDPKISLLHSNLSGSLAALHRFDEAEKEALTALKLDSRNVRAHFVLGGILLQKKGGVSQGIAHLREAEDAIPSAKTAVEQVCAISHVAGCP